MLIFGFLFADSYQHLCYCISPTVSVFMFDYASTVISYSLIGVAVFTGKYENMSASDLASNVSMVRGYALLIMHRCTCAKAYGNLFVSVCP